MDVSCREQTGGTRVRFPFLFFCVPVCAWDCLLSILLDVVFTCVNYRCTFFQWAEFNDDGEPPWVLGFQGGGKVDVEIRGGGE